MGLEVVKCANVCNKKKGILRNIYLELPVVLLVVQGGEGFPFWYGGGDEW